MAGIVVSDSPARLHRPRRLHLPPYALVVVAAWAVLVGAHVTGSGDLLHHDAVLDSGSAPGLTGLSLFLAGWSAMVAAMMIPATWSLGRRSSAGLERDASPAGFLGGFLLVWGVAGAAALAFDGGVHQAVHAVPGLESRPGLVSAGVLAVAGLVQLLPSTARHIARCRPLLAADTLGTAFVTGRDHGLRCLRADGPLMLVMFATGGSLVWMVVLTAVMVAERSARWGRAVAGAAGTALVAAAVLSALSVA